MVPCAAQRLVPRAWRSQGTMSLQEARAVGSGTTKRSVATVHTRLYGGAGASGAACASRDLHACRMCLT